MGEDKILDIKVNKNPDRRAGHFADNNRFKVPGLGWFSDLFEALGAAVKAGLMPKKGGKTRITEED